MAALNQMLFHFIFLHILYKNENKQTMFNRESTRHERKEIELNKRDYLRGQKNQELTNLKSGSDMLIWANHFTACLCFVNCPAKEEVWVSVFKSCFTKPQLLRLHDVVLFGWSGEMINLLDTLPTLIRTSFFYSHYMFRNCIYIQLEIFFNAKNKIPMFMPL